MRTAESVTKDDTSLKSRPAFFQPKLTVNTPGDQYEQEADAMANKVMHMQATVSQSFFKPAITPVQRKCKGCGEDDKMLHRKEGNGAENSNSEELSSYINLISSPGQPLPVASRQFFEPRFGRDFSNVKVHTDSVAAKSAQSINALAYTTGNNIVFNSGQYSPQSETGQKLMAHELTHVVQQQGTGKTVQAKKAPTPPQPAKVFYQELLDEQADKRKTLPRSISGMHFDILEELPALQTLINLAEAIDSGDKKSIPGLISKVEKLDVFRVQSHPSRELVFDMIGRLISLGLDNQSTRLRLWYIKKEDFFRGDSDIKRNPNLPGIVSWWGIIKAMTDKKPADNVQAASNITALLSFFSQVNKELSLAPPGRTRHENYPDELAQVLVETFKAIQQNYQVVLDDAINNLAAGKGAPLLMVAKGKLEEISTAVNLQMLSTSVKVPNLSLDITVTKFEKKNSMHLDAFAEYEPKGNRTAKINFYEPDFDPVAGREVSSSFFQVLSVRNKQIKVLEDTYGLSENGGVKTEEAKENATVLSQMGKTGLRLENDDDWRKFVLLKFDEQLKQGNTKVQALDNVIDFLKNYLEAFTVHSPYDIDDAVENPFGKQFPRALTGQFIQDCGIYALRIAYILSLVRMHPKLKLKFKMIALPVHVGLIITGEDMPAYFVNNNDFQKVKISEIKDAWTNTDEAGNDRKTPAKFDEDQALAEISGFFFIEGVDLPYQTFDVPQPASNPAATKNALWYKLYQGQIRKSRLFGPQNDDKKSDNYQFQLRYLKLLDMTIEHNNTAYLNFRNGIAMDTWKTSEPTFAAAIEKLNSATDAADKQKAQDHLNDLADSYDDVMQPELKKVTDAYKPVLDEEAEINSYIKANPDVFNKRASVTAGKRIEKVMKGHLGNGMWWWEKRFDDDDSKIRNGDIENPLYKKPEAPIAR